MRKPLHTGGERDGGPTQRVTRLRLYSAGLIIAFMIFLTTQASNQTALSWLICSALLIGLGASVVTQRQPATYLPGVAIAAVCISAIIPLAPGVIYGGRSFAATAAHAFIIPSIFVAVFGGRVLAENNALRFERFWRTPLQTAGCIRLQSTAASLALGAALTFVFYIGASHLPNSSADPAIAVIEAAVEGGTALHAAIIFLFFFICAHLGEAVLLQMAERAFFQKVRRALAERHETDDDGLSPTAIDRICAEAPHIRVARLLQNAIRESKLNSDGADLAIVSSEQFRNASRGFIRGLLPILPLLGFIGTIIGLSTTLADLPNAIATSASSDSGSFSGAIAGLALKFQTTLLGLLASAIAGLWLLALERREAEFEAECYLVFSKAFDRTIGPEK